METVTEIIKNAELFSKIDNILTEVLKSKSIKEMENELIAEINENRGKYSDNFSPALVFGKKGEAIYKKRLELEGHLSISECDNITHDMVSLKNSKNWTHEVKTDSRHMFIGDNGNLIDTKNILFEYESRGKESGFRATKAEFFVTYFPQLSEFWIIRTKKLIGLVDGGKYEFTDKKDIGDKGSHTHGILIKRKIIESEFSVKKTY